MSATTIQVPAEHVEAIRQSLIARRDHAERREEIDSLLGQIAGDSDGVGPRRLSGSRAVLWNAVYDALCVAAEQLADDCNEYWRGIAGAQPARSGIADVSARLELLVGLGPPPGR
jgi:hypothetical protein